ncbi:MULTISPECIES: VanZ family protein [unclassified Persicobacter]|uniref:VanZ-like domain-containing protein n=2 Tax=Persicobacter TaxID=59740 RepID=A0AAN5AHT4_9BACT|nr:VanZ family protein [Persicobacter sp. CCB-QB2]GJM59635.1 hypothetical protein PEDI_01870 [Persicobacter diffluens]
MILRYQLFTIIWVIIILFLTLLPASSLPSGINWYIPFDKLAHAGVFGILALLLTIGSCKQYSVEHMKRFPYHWTISLCFVFGLLIEVLQGSFTSRHFEWMDLVADMIGAFIGLIVFFFVYKW